MKQYFKHKSTFLSLKSLIFTEFYSVHFSNSPTKKVSKRGENKMSKSKRKSVDEKKIKTFCTHYGRYMASIDEEYPREVFSSNPKTFFTNLLKVFELRKKEKKSCTDRLLSNVAYFTPKLSEEIKQKSGEHIKSLGIKTRWSFTKDHE